MSSTPLCAWSFAFPSGSATRPSTTIGLFQWPAPLGSAATSRPLVGTYTFRPPPGAQTQRRPPATTGLVPPLPFRHATERRPLRNRYIAVPPLSAANIHVPDDACQTTGAVKRSVPDGVDRTWSSPPLCGDVPCIRATLRTRILPSLPPCARYASLSSTGEVDPRSASVELSSSVFDGV